MKFSQFHQTIKKILDVDLPSGPSIIGEGYKIAGNMKVGRTAFMDEMSGILNQKIEDQALPVDVASNIMELDFLPCPRLENNFGNLLEYKLNDTK